MIHHVNRGDGRHTQHNRALSRQLFMHEKELRTLPAVRLADDVKMLAEFGGGYGGGKRVS
jgi:hypothetical protein